MEDAGTIPSMQLDSTIVGTRHCFDAWRETVRPFFDVEPLAGIDSGKERARAWLVDRLLFSDVVHSPQSLHHQSAHANKASHLSLQIWKHGGSRGVHAGTPYVSMPGMVQVFDHARESCSVTESAIGEVAVAGVTVPYDAIGYDPGRHPARMTFPRTSPIGRLLAKTCFAIVDELPTVRHDEAAALADGFCGLLRGLIIPGPAQDPKQRMRRAELHAEMRSYIDRRLSEPDLGTEKLCREFGVSRASVYRAFADTGGVARYITNRRLDRAYYQLLSAPPSRGAVKEIGSRWGFVETGHFSRLFSRRFGVSPSVALSAGQAGTTPAPDGAGSGFSLAADWLRGI